MEVSVQPPSRRAFLAAVPVLVAAAASPARAQQRVAVRVGSSPNDPYAEAYYAQELGLFAKAGLDVTMVPMANGAAAAAGVASGALDVGISNPVELGTAITHGLPFGFFAGGGLYTSESPLPVLCVAKDSPIANVKDLAGKTIAVNGLKDLGEVGIKGFLVQNGVDVKNLQFVELRFSEIGAALARGTIAAGLLTEPALTAAKDAGQVRVIGNVYDSIGKRFYISGWFSTATWYKAHRDLATTYTNVMYETARWANTHHNESADILSKYSKIGTQITRRMTRCQYAESLNPDGMQSALDLAARFDITSRRVMASELMAKA